MIRQCLNMRRLLPLAHWSLSISHCLRGLCRSAKTRRIQSPVEAGFTLAELVIAITLIGLIALVVLPRIGLAKNTLASTSRQLIGTMRTLYLTASATKRVHRLYLDLDQQSYWAVVVQPDGERPPALPGLLDKIPFPPEVRLTDVVTPAQGKVTITRAVIQFTPGGRTERSLIHLTDRSGNVFTLQLNPITGSVQVLDRYADLPPSEPLTDVVKTAFFSPTDISTLKSPSGVPR